MVRVVCQPDGPERYLKPFSVIDVKQIYLEDMMSLINAFLVIVDVCLPVTR